MHAAEGQLGQSDQLTEVKQTTQKVADITSTVPKLKLASLFSLNVIQTTRIGHFSAFDAKGMLQHSGRQGFVDKLCWKLSHA